MFRGDDEISNEVVKVDDLFLYEGKYDATHGFGSIDVTSQGSETYVISGNAILAGPGNVTDEETVRARTAKIDTEITLNEGVGIYIDADNPECNVTFRFRPKNSEEMMLEIVGGERCDTTIENFAGKYYKAYYR